MDIIENVRQYVEAECKKPTSKYGYGPYEFHFVPMVKYAQKLCDEIGGDKEIITIAAWLHDIGSIVYGRKDHHVTGAEISEMVLRNLNFPDERIEKVKKCILNHRGSTENKLESIEEKIIAEADAISNFDNLAGIFMAAFVYEKMDQGEAKKSVKQKLENKYRQLNFEQSKKMIEPKYKAAMLLLE